MHVSPQGRAFIGVQEGCRLRAYRDATGTLTIGYGHTSMAGEPHVTVGMVITKAQADQILAADLEKYEQQVLREVHVSLNQAQFDALVSFTYNCGEGSLRKMVAVSRLNSRDYAAVPAALEQYDRSKGQVLGALVRRRRAEAAMFQGHYPNMPVLHAAVAVRTAMRTITSVFNV